MQWKQQFKPQELLDLCKPSLKLVSPANGAMILAVLEDLFQVWVGEINSLVNSSGVDSTESSFNLTGTQNGTTSESKSSGKRKATPQDSADESSGEDKDRPPSKKKRLSSRKSVGKKRRWACPFYQRDHRRYCRKSCASYPGFEIVSRVK